MNQVLIFYRQKNYQACLRLLKKEYVKDPYRPALYVLFFLVYRKRKKHKKALQWLREGHYLLPGHIRLAQLYAYFTVIWKKNPEEALVPLSVLTEKEENAFTNHILSRFYHKKGDLERAQLFAGSAYNSNSSVLIADWYAWILYRYRDMEKLRKMNNFTARRLSGNLKISDKPGIKTLSEKLEFLQNFDIILLEKQTINNSLFRYHLFNKYAVILPQMPMEAGMEILKDKGFEFLKEWNEKKEKNLSFIDENWVKILAFLLLLFLLFYIWKGVT